MNDMKTIKHILLLTFAAFALTNCADEASYVPGEKENPDNFGVYFPEQTVSTTVEVDPKAETKVTFKVARKRTDEAIIVPFNVDSENKDVFTISPIAFKQGAAETNVTVKFDKAEVGTTYKCTISIDDPEYVSLYGTNATSLSFSVVRAGWELVKGPNGETKGKWRDDIIVGLYSIQSATFNPNPELDVEIYERSDVKGLYRMKVYGGSNFIRSFTGGNYSYAEDKDVWTTVNASDPDKVYLPLQTAGVTFNSGDGEVSFGSYVPENFSLDESAAQYGTMKDGVIEFPVQGIMITIATLDGYAYANMNGLTRILMPGVTVPDYTVSLSKEECKDGVVDVVATLSSDVKKFKYSVREGAIDEGAASLLAQELDQAGTFDGEITETSTLHLSCKETGKYTLVGCVYDAAGTMQGYASVSFGYVAKGEEKPVILTYGLEATNEFAGEGINPDNSAKFYAYGQDIESLTYGFYKSKYLVGKKLDEVLKDSGKAFTSEELEKVNDKGFSSMIKGLNGDCQYTMVIMANNGYVTSITTKDYHTTGVYNPGMDTYDYEDFLEQQPSKEELIKDWNYYAMDLTVEDETLTRYARGTVSIRQSTETKYDFDIEGLAGVKFEKGGVWKGSYIPEIEELSKYKGAFVLIAPKNEDFATYEGTEMFTGFIPIEEISKGAIYFGPGMYFGEVADGYLYGVPARDAIEQKLTFRYLYTGSSTTAVSAMTEMMLVDPAKDKGGIPDLPKSKISEIRKQAKEVFARRNYVEIPELASAQQKTKYVRNLAADMTPVAVPVAKHAEAKITVESGIASKAASRGGFILNGLYR